jgi:hypothetical protein
MAHLLVKSAVRWLGLKTVRREQCARETVCVWWYLSEQALPRITPKTEAKLYAEFFAQVLTLPRILHGVP